MNLVCSFKFHADTIFRHKFYLSSKNVETIKISTSKILVVLYFMLRINHLFSCLHLLINSERLLSNISWFRNLIISNFSIKHKLRKLWSGFPWTFLVIFHVVIGTLLFCFKSHLYFDSSVAFLYLSCLLSLTWLLYLSLNSV